MPEILTENSLLICTKGTTPALLKVTSQQFNKINGLLVATEIDKTPMLNIPCFGVCNMGSYPPPCMPSPIVWENTSKISTINGQAALTKDSSIKCALGGTINIANITQKIGIEK